MAARKRNQIVRVRIGDTIVHPTAQRALVPAQLNKRMKELDLDAIGVLHGVNIDGVVNIVDGQHRRASLLGHGFDDWIVHVELHPDAVDPVVASRLFLRLNARATPNSWATFDNALKANDPIARGVERVLARFGLVPAQHPGHGKVPAVAAASRIYAKDEGETLTEAVDVLVAAFGRTPAAVEGKLLEGAAALLGELNGALDKAVLVKKLAKYDGSAPSILGDAKGLRRMRHTTLPRAVAEVMLTTYNVGRRDKLTAPGLIG